MKHVALEIEHYLSGLLGGDFKVVPCDGNVVKRLPLIIKSRYDFYQCRLYSRNLLLSVVADTDGLSPAVVKKHAEIIENSFGLPCAFVFDSLPSYQTGRLYKSGINFIIIGKIIFMPHLLIDIRKVRDNQPVAEKIPPLAQVIIIRQLLFHDINGNTSRRIASLLETSYQTANRSVKWLSEHGIINLAGEKEKVIEFEIVGKELWKHGKTLMLNPIARVLFTNDDVTGLVSGVNALSKYTMLNDVAGVTVALDSKQFAEGGYKADKHYGSTQIQIWRYNPLLLSKSSAVDPLSLYLTLVDNEDERVSMELDSMINGIEW